MGRGHGNYPRECPLCGSRTVFLHHHLARSHEICVTDLMIEGILGPDGLMDWNSEGILVINANFKVEGLFLSSRVRDNRSTAVRRITNASHLSKIGEKKACVKCNYSFKIGDRFVSNQSRGTGKTKRYCVGCFTDAKGVPIFE